MNCSTPGFPVLNYLPICSNSYPLNRWCYLNISTSSTPFSSCPQSFLASGSFSMNRLFASGSPSIGASTSASVLTMNIQGWFPLGKTGLISLPSKGLSKVFSSTTVRRHQFFSDLNLIEDKINEWIYSLPQWNEWMCKFLLSQGLMVLCCMSVSLFLHPFIC